MVGFTLKEQTKSQTVTNTQGQHTDSKLRITFRQDAIHRDRLIMKFAVTQAVAQGILRQAVRDQGR